MGLRARTHAHTHTHTNYFEDIFSLSGLVIQYMFHKKKPRYKPDVIKFNRTINHTTENSLRWRRHGHFGTLHQEKGIYA